MSKGSEQTKERYHVYVVELNRRVWTENWRFRKANPQYMGIKECLYVGMTSQSPQIRFKKHKTGHRNKKGHKISSYLVEKYGSFLRPSLYKGLNPLTRSEARRIEPLLAKRLMKQGFAVWWN